MIEVSNIKNNIDNNFLDNPPVMPITKDDTLFNKPEPIIKGKMKDIEKPNNTQMIFLMCVLIYFFIRSIILFMLLVSILLFLDYIYKEGYNIRTINVWLNDFIEDIKKSSNK